MADKPEHILLGNHRNGNATWHGAAFIVEALLLLVFLAFALAIFMQLFSTSHNLGVEERQLTQAVLLASNDAEAFAANPSAGGETSAFDANGNQVEAVEEDGYLVDRAVTMEHAQSGTLYRAVITVSHNGHAVYELETARYAHDQVQGGDAS